MSDQITKHAVPTGVWRADRVHSTVGFAVPYMAGTFQGTFSEFDAQLSDGVLRGTAEVASVQVKDPNLEAHLQAPDFFDADRYPQLSFEAGEIARAGDELTIVNDPAPDPFGGERFGLQLETAVDRTKFGISWNNPLPSGDPALANEVTIIVDLQLAKES